MLSRAAPGLIRIVTKARLKIYVPGFPNVDEEAHGHEKTAAGLVAGIFGLASHRNGERSIVPGSMSKQHHHSPGY